MKGVKENSKKENVWNIPNPLTISRIIIAFFIVYLIFGDYSFKWVFILFVIGMLTDFLDGQIARRFDQVTEFGRKADMIADRFLMILTAGALIIDYSIQGVFDRGHLLQIFLILSREIIAIPFVIILFTVRGKIPQARFIGKLTTFLQGVTFPALILGIHLPQYDYSISLTIITCITGIVSGIVFATDVGKAYYERERRRKN